MIAAHITDILLVTGLLTMGTMIVFIIPGQVLRLLLVVVGPE